MSAFGPWQTCVTAVSAFGGKANIFAAHMSASDPKRTLVTPLPGHSMLPLRWFVLALGCGDETTRVHHTSQRRNGHTADCSVGAATRADCADWCAHECRRE